MGDWVVAHWWARGEGFSERLQRQFRQHWNVENQHCFVRQPFFDIVAIAFPEFQEDFCFPSARGVQIVFCKLIQTNLQS